MLYRLTVHCHAPEDEEAAMARLRDALAEEGVDRYELHAHEYEASGVRALHLEFSIDAMSSWDAREVKGLDLVTTLLQRAEIPFSRQAVLTSAVREGDAATQ